VEDLLAEQAPAPLQNLASLQKPDAPAVVSKKPTKLNIRKPTVKKA
jgi:hypothetical protein